MSIKSYIMRGLRYVAHGVPTQVVNPVISYSAPSRRLDGKRILVTGGGRGLGLAMARKFAAEGAGVIIAGRNEDTLRQASEQVPCPYLVCDLSQAESLAGVIEKAADMLGGLDCLVNNAGISLHEGNIRNVTLEGFERQIDTNLRAPYFLAQQFVKHCEERGQGGSILFMSSERGEFCDDIPYGLTKAAINSLVRGLAARMAPVGIRVNAIAPGVTATDMTGIKAKGNMYSPYNATGRTYLPEEVAEAACFLLSDDAGCISGQILACNNANSVNPYFK